MVGNGQKLDEFPDRGYGECLMSKVLESCSRCVSRIGFVGVRVRGRPFAASGLHARPAAAGLHLDRHLPRRKFWLRLRPAHADEPLFRQLHRLRLQLQWLMGGPYLRRADPKRPTVLGHEGDIAWASIDGSGTGPIVEQHADRHRNDLLEARHDQHAACACRLCSQ